VEQTRQVYPRGRLAACSRSFLPLSSLRCSLRRFYRKPPCLVSLFSRAAIRVACFLSAWRENPGWGASHPRARRFPRDSCAIVHTHTHTHTERESPLIGHYALSCVSETATGQPVRLQGCISRIRMRSSDDAD